MIVILVLIIAIVLIAVYSNPATRYCRWREHRDGEVAAFTCIYCGAKTTGLPGQPPEICLRGTSDRDA